MLNLCDPRTIKQVMDMFGINFKKEYGQNFLTDNMTVEDIADACSDDADTTVLEIGPGIGCMTRELAKRYKDVLSQHELYATGTTGTLIMGETGLTIHRMKSGPLGGDQQIGAMLANGDIDLILFLRDPLTAQPHEPDVSALLRLGDVQSIPLATNATSATIMLEALKNKIYFA